MRRHCARSDGNDRLTSSWRRGESSTFRRISGCDGSTRYVAVLVQDENTTVVELAKKSSPGRRMRPKSQLGTGSSPGTRICWKIIAQLNSIVLSRNQAFVCFDVFDEGCSAQT